MRKIIAAITVIAVALTLAALWFESISIGYAAVIHIICVIVLVFCMQAEIKKSSCAHGDEHQEENKKTNNNIS